MANNDKDRDIAQWTMMVYMAGDNNLAQDCVNALVSLKNVPNTNEVNVIAQFDPRDPRISSSRLVIHRSEKTTKIPSLLSHVIGVLDDNRVAFEKGKVEFHSDHCVHKPIPHVEGVLETDTSDPETLFDFISWSSENFPAKRYMLILVGHSAGVEDGFLLKDEHPPSAMDLLDLKEVLKQTRDKLNIKIDLLGMDSCLMSMAEICLELRELVDVFVGSQSMTPNPGWPYAEILKRLKKCGGEIEADDLSVQIVNDYIGFYVEQAINNGTSTDLAALKVDKCSQVAESVRELAAELKKTLKDQEIQRALILSHWQAQSYNGELFVDLADFCSLLDKSLAGTSYEELIGKKCKAVVTAVSELVLQSCFCGVDYQYSNGLSIYFPWSLIFFDYQRLEFAQEKGADWYAFLRTYIEETRRLPRGEDKPSYNVDSEIFLQGFATLNSNVGFRRVQPLDHGPGPISHSMRNPPQRLRKHVIRGCTIDSDC